MIEVFFDIEGDLDFDKPLWQIAAVAVDSSTHKVIDSIELKILVDENLCSDTALVISGYNTELWKKTALHETACILKFTEFLKKYLYVKVNGKKTFYVAQLVGHNAQSFDGPKLRAWYKRNGSFLPASFLVLDTLQLAMWYFRDRKSKPTNFKLGTLGEWFCIKPEGNLHDAMVDLMLCVKIAEIISK